MYLLFLFVCFVYLGINLKRFKSKMNTHDGIMSCGKRNLMCHQDLIKMSNIFLVGTISKRERFGSSFLLEQDLGKRLFDQCYNDSNIETSDTNLVFGANNNLKNRIFIYYGIIQLCLPFIYDNILSPYSNLEKGRDIWASVNLWINPCLQEFQRNVQTDKMNYGTLSETTRSENSLIMIIMYPIFSMIARNGFDLNDFELFRALISVLSLAISSENISNVFSVDESLHAHHPFFHDLSVAVDICKLCCQVLSTEVDKARER